MLRFNSVTTRTVDPHRSKPLISLVPFNLQFHCFQGKGHCYVTHSKEDLLPPLPLQARATYSSVITTKNGRCQFFYFVAESSAKTVLFIPFSLYFVLITENYNIGELQIQGRQSIS